MIKKLFFAFVMAVMPVFVTAKEAFSVMLWPIPPSYVDPEPATIPVKRTPGVPIKIEIQDNTVSFSPFEETATLSIIRNSDDVEVFSQVLPPGCGECTIPNLEAGEYTIKIELSTVCYTGGLEI